MDTPPLPTADAAATATVTAVFHPDSADSLPHSRSNDSLNADPPKLRLMCSYGGHIVPRPHDKTLSYIGGDTRIIVIDRHTSFSDLHARLSKNLLNNRPFSLRYQLPGEDLDSLISVSTDEDLENMVDEYDRLNNAGRGLKRGRLRLFLFPGSGSPSSGQVVLETSSAKSEDWFFDTLNGKPSSFFAASDQGFSESSSVNCLLGLDDELVGKTAVVGGGEKYVEAQMDGAKTGGTGIGNISGNSNSAMNLDVHSIPDSPMLGTTSSFGSTSSSPSVPNLPPTGVHVDDNLKAGGLGIEEQFQPQVSVGVGEIVNLPPPQKQEVGGLTVGGITAETVASGLPPVVVVVGSDYTHPVVSDDERSEHGAYPKVQQTQPQVQQQQQIPQLLQKQTSGFDLPSPDSVSSDGNARNPLSKQAIYQEQLKQIQPGNPSPAISSDQVDLKAGDQIPTNIQMQQQAQETGYMSPHKFDQNYPQLHQSHHFIPAGNHFIPAGAVPFVSYYPVYPPQQQHNSHQPYPVYILPGNHNQPYNFSVHQPNYSELAPSTPSSCPQTPPAVTMTSHTAFSQAASVPSSAPEMSGGLYGTGAPQVVQLPSGQHQVQYVAFSPFPHPPQPVAPSSAGNSTYDFADPAHLQMYYGPLPPHKAAQYQTNTSTPATIIPDISSQHTS